MTLSVFGAMPSEEKSSQYNTGKVYLMAFGSPKDINKINRYKKVAGSIMKKHGAIFPPVKFKINDVIKGDSIDRNNPNPTFLNYIEFPDRQHILNALSDPEYISVINDRNNGFNHLNIFILTQ